MAKAVHDDQARPMINNLQGNIHDICHNTGLFMLVSKLKDDGQRFYRK